MTDKEKIRAEIIKRRKAIPKEEDDKRMKAVYGGIIFELTEILEFIDSLPVEPKFMVGQVVCSSNGTILKIIGIGQYCYHCDNDYSFGFDIQDEFELVGESASDDLKEEIIKRWKVLHGSGNPTPFDTFNGIACHFANWQLNKIRKEDVSAQPYDFSIGDRIRLKGNVNDTIGFCIVDIREGYYWCDADITIPHSKRHLFEKFE